MNMSLSYDDIRDLPLYKKLIGYLMFLAFLFALFYFLLYLPKLHEIESQESQIHKLEQEIIIKRIQAKNLRLYKEELKLLGEKYNMLLQQLPNKDMIDMILMNIASYERKEHLDSLLFKPGNEIKEGFYAIVPVQLKIKGTYKQIGKFFVDITNLPRIVAIKDFRFSNPEDKGGIVQLTADCNIETFRYIPETKQNSGKNKRVKNTGAEKR